MFHPDADFEKNLSGNKYPLNGEQRRLVKGNWVSNTPENYIAESLEKIEAGKIWLADQIESTSRFLARVLNTPAARAQVQ